MNVLLAFCSLCHFGIWVYVIFSCARKREWFSWVVAVFFAISNALLTIGAFLRWI